MAKLLRPLFVPVFILRGQLYQTSPDYLQTYLLFVPFICKKPARIYSNWAQPTDRQAKTLDSHALLVAALIVAMSRSRQARSVRRSGCFFYKRLGGVIGNQLIGPYFYRENLTGARSSNTTKICNKKYNVPFEKQKLDAVSRDTRV
uniref:Uncharacterized protein n=1 Tax=Rhodnius prolixus TaxID=13249 RepID=T1IDM4_RHOPR